MRSSDWRSDVCSSDLSVRPSAELAYAGNIGEATSIWAGFNYQERRNPKKKVSYRFSGEPVTSHDGFPGTPARTDYITDPDFDDFEAQDDTRDGRNVSGHIELNTRSGDGGRSRIAGPFCHTTPEQVEHETGHT